MPEFISKLQHKTYEKGEFSDDKARSLDETIELITSFPWDKERGSDVQLTGPSVAIADEYGNCLKVALYFGGKFCLYYLDRSDHFYEYHTARLNEACDMVTKFFDGQIPLQSFDKHLFNSGVRKHFENGNFEYRANSNTALLQMLLMLFLILTLLVFCTALCFAAGPNRLLGILGLLFDIFLCHFFYQSFKIYLKAKNMFITISSGHDSFIYGTTYNYKTYQKKDLAAINAYGGVKQSKFSLIELVFNDNTTLFVPQMLIGVHDLLGKFRDVKVNIITGLALIDNATARFIK